MKESLAKLIEVARRNGDRIVAVNYDYDAYLSCIRYRFSKLQRDSKRLPDIPCICIVYV